jgi:hypothetical protein
MDATREYLHIHPDYVAHLGGMRWAGNGEAIDYTGGATLAFTGEVVGLIEGFAKRRPLIHFAHLLHLLHLLLRPHPEASPFARLQQAFRTSGRLHRNVGALAAHLCAEIPPVARPPSARDLWRLLVIESGRGLHAIPGGEIPSLHPDQFQSLVARELARLDDEGLWHWLRHGDRPIREEALPVAEVLLEQRPLSFREFLDQLNRRPRLAGALPFVAQLLGALSLPPRRLDTQELPMGGYSDVATRGQPEQLLPSQFALDELEFLRRHGENELLYFRREEPAQQARENLVLVLDQGVRTWGVVRLVLTAAVLALGQVAESRRQPFRLATSSSATLLPASRGPLPLEMDKEAFAALLEASDLTANPGLALEAVLEQEPQSLRDVVLLTHPRNLGEPEVQAAAARVSANTRLFALSVEESGEAELAELRHGMPVSLVRFRVDLTARVEPRPSTCEPATSWSGEVEPVPCPFRFGVGAEPIAFFDFDHDHDWLLAVTAKGLIQATRSDGRGWEILPRPMVEGQVFTGRWLTVLGVAAGFVLVGQGYPGWILAHYDLHTRRCRVYCFESKGLLAQGWSYVRKLHTVVFSWGGESKGVHLGTGSQDLPPALQRLPYPAALEDQPDRQVLRLPLQGNGGPERSEQKWNWPRLVFHPNTGTLEPLHVEPEWTPFTPQADGRAALQGSRLLSAACQGHTLAVLHRKRVGPQHAVSLFRWPEGFRTEEIAFSMGRLSFALSADGQLLARLIKPAQAEVRDVTAGPGAKPLRTCVGRYHHDCEVILHDHRLILLVGQKLLHLVDWSAAPSLLLACYDGTEMAIEDRLRVMAGGGSRSRSVSWGLPRVLQRSNGGRFRLSASHGGRTAVVDRFGQVALFDASQELIALLFAFRRDLAIWLPDGTCLGSSTLLGRPATPGAERRIAQVLQEAPGK